MFKRSSRQYESYKERNSLGRIVRRVLGFVLILLLVYEIITTIFVQSVEVQTSAMEPTVTSADRLLMVPLLYGPRIRMSGWIVPGFADPQRGDLVALRPAYMEEPRSFRRIADPFVRFFTLQNNRTVDGTDWRSDLQVKRIIGLPGDTIRIERNIALVRPAGDSSFALESSFASMEYTLGTELPVANWQPLDPFGAATEAIVVPEGEYFVLSDNRVEGIDSRHWGSVPWSYIHGKIVLRFWPFAEFGRP